MSCIVYHFIIICLSTIKSLPSFTHIPLILPSQLCTSTTSHSPSCTHPPSPTGRDILDMAGNLVKPGITTESIDLAVHDYTVSRGAYPSPLNYWHFPKACCTSVNEVICHGIPDARKLERGDILNIDISVYLNGYHGDLNETYLVGSVEDCDEDSKRLIRTTYESLKAAMEAAEPGVACRKFGDIITDVVKKEQFQVVRYVEVIESCKRDQSCLFRVFPLPKHVLWPWYRHVISLCSQYSVRILSVFLLKSLPLVKFFHCFYVFTISQSNTDTITRTKQLGYSSQVFLLYLLLCVIIFLTLILPTQAWCSPSSP